MSRWKPSARGWKVNVDNPAPGWYEAAERALDECERDGGTWVRVEDPDRMRCDLCPNPATHGHLCASDAWSEDVAKYQGDSDA